MLNHDMKNKNILARFETKNLGSNIKKYTVFFNDNKKAYMICMNSETKEQATQSCADRFGDKFSHVEC